MKNLLSPASHGPKITWFILGRESLLSAAEIAAVLNLKKIRYTGGQILKNSGPVNSSLMDRLGGTIKIGRELAADVDETGLMEAIEIELKKLPGKINFGLSLYGSEANSIKQIQKLGLTIKNNLKNTGLSVRFVFNDEIALSSVSVQKNGLLEKGREFLMEKNGERYNLAVTEAVQPFEQFSARDYGRPGRDDVSGMLPPKLALMMLNLAAPESGTVILDPFCGSGTILTEATRLGFTRLIGADLSAKAIADTEKNFSWLKLKSPKLFQGDVADLSKKISLQSVDAIVTEPFLGRPLQGREIKEFLIRQLNGLKPTYLTAFSEFKKILKPNGTVVMIIPKYRFKNDWLELNLTKEIKKLGFAAQPLLQTESQTYTSLLYARPSQHVGREIWKFTLLK